jgi:[protein-PII] uridylyltransferase
MLAYHVAELSRKAGPLAPDDVKAYLKKMEESAVATHMREVSGTVVVAEYTAAIDALLKLLYQRLCAETGVDVATSLAAVGGYGRGELNARSDIDLLLVYAGPGSPRVEELTRRMLYLMWDAGLDVAFSIRSVDECVKLAREDLKTSTALLDLRFIAGDEAVYAELTAAVDKKIFTPAMTERFLREKLRESEERRAKFGGSVYILEPNIKEGEGGLRDLHTTKWLLAARAKSGHPMDAERLLSNEERAELDAAVDFLYWVRNDLHFDAGRKNDQLGFGQQKRIAAALGFIDTPEALGVERFMQHYYRHASNLSRLSALMLARGLHDRRGGIKRGEAGPRRLDDDFLAIDGEVHAASEDVFTKNPSAMVGVFLHMQTEALRLSPETRDRLLRSLSLVSDALRSGKASGKLLTRILKGHNVYGTLSDMHRLKVLGALMPEFDAIGGKVQHDLYHIYTVDAHTLFAIREIERLSSQYKKDYFILSTIYEELERPELLMLGVLFHDIGKSLGKGHAENGAIMAERIMKRLGFKKAEIATVAFLVRHHLKLADTAQHRDIHDEKLIMDFARTVGTIERLNMLYLLTFADVRAVGPDVWSHWKGALFQELYFKVLTAIERGTFTAEDAAENLKAIMRGVKRHIKAGLRDRVDDYFNLLPERYFLYNKPAYIASDIELVHALKDKPLVMSLRHDKDRSYTSLAICTFDTAGLFSKITGVLAANSINILGAQINTLKNGIALDILQITTAQGGLIKEQARIKKIEKDLFNVITGVERVDKLVGARKRPSILDRPERPRPPTRIFIDNEVSDRYTVIDVHTHDRIGLLYAVTSVFARLGLYIALAKISTKGEAVSDIFYVNDIFGQKIFYDKRLTEITKALEDALREDAGEGAAGK